MKTSEEQFKLFNSKLKKYSTSEVAKIFARLNREYVLKQSNGPQIKQFISGYYSTKIYIQPWLFSEIVFFSTKYNDYKKKLSETDALELYLLYDKYATLLKDEYTRQNYSNTSDNILPPIMYGNMQEQALYEISIKTFINRFNRNYYMLKDETFDGKTLNTIINQKFNTNLDTYIKTLSIIALISTRFTVLNHNAILQNIEYKELFMKIIDSLSINYDDCRACYKPENKNVFKIKPILLTSLQEYIVPNLNILFYNYGDILYWILKDEFKGTTVFVNQFGNIFEDYVHKILIKQFGNENIKKIPCVKNKKSADFAIETEHYTILLEVKAGVARADAKQATLNRESLNSYIKNNITDAMMQLDASAKELRKNKEIICIIVNYDTIFVEDCLLFDISTLYNSVNYNAKQKLLLFNIDKFENFIYEFNTLEKLDNIFYEYRDKELKSYQLSTKNSTDENHIYENVFKYYTDLFIEKLKNIQ